MSPHDEHADRNWGSDEVRLYDEPGERPNVKQIVGDYAGLNRYSVMSIQMIIAKDGDSDELDELVGLVMHPELDGVAISCVNDTPAAGHTSEQLTAILREMGWRWATPEEVRGQFNGYLVPGLGASRGPVLNGEARTRALR